MMEGVTPIPAEVWGSSPGFIGKFCAFRMPGACGSKRPQQMYKSDGRTRVQEGKGRCGAAGNRNISGGEVRPVRSRAGRHFQRCVFAQRVNRRLPGAGSRRGLAY